MKKIASFLIILSCLFSFALAENLIVNGDFDLIDANGMPQGWNTDMWITDEGVSRLFVSSDGCAAVINADANDARFTQTVRVEPDSFYRFSCRVKAEGCSEEGHGANISFENTFSYSNEVFDTNGAWETLTVYGHTGEKQTEVTLMLRVGGYSGINTGTAYFDDVEMEKVDALPEDVFACSLETASSERSASSVSLPETDAAPERNTETYLLTACLLCVFALALSRRTGRMERSGVRPRTVLLIGGALALILRAVLSFKVRGYNTDINCFTSWSERIFTTPLTSFYSPDFFCDYPPLYMLCLLPAALLRRVFGIAAGSAGYLILLKLIPCLCDFAAARVIYAYAKKKGVPAIRGAVLALVYLFNPCVWLDSAAWGQIDAVLALMIVLSAVSVDDDRPFSALIFFTLALLVKPQALLFAPVGLIAIAVRLIARKDKKLNIRAAEGLLASLGLLLVFGLVFFPGKPVSGLIGLYSGTMSGYSYITVNALNLYTLLGKNWAATAYHTGLTVLAWTLFALSYGFAAFLTVFSERNKKGTLTLIGGALIALIFAFGPMMHERYLFPLIPLIFLAYVSLRDRRLLIALTLFSFTLALNEVLVLQGGMTAANYGHLQSSEQWLNAILSFLNCAGALFLAYAAFDICVRKRVCVLSPDSGETEAAEIVKPDWRLKVRPLEAALVLAVTAAYAVLAFTGLGLTYAPESTWVSSKGGEYVVFDLGGEERFQMLYYGNICNTSFTVELSNDGEDWTEPVRAEYAQGVIFRWLVFTPRDENGNIIYDDTLPSYDGSAYISYASTGEKYPYQTARFVRVTADRAGLKLSEFAFWTEEDALLPVAIYETGGALEGYASDANLLIDEQEKAQRTPSCLNGTYFDEIYHARTAYELLHGENAYEWTHPQLGKTIMSLGIRIFGMTPFGWRFTGALTGVLMLPLMYLLAKQLTGSKKLSFIAMLLLAFDSMHFTQTRIATIDSYAVFFIMLMYLFMFRYVRMPWREVKLSRTLVPLGLCGITTGLGCASKWICCYAAVGLAVLFFGKAISEIAHAGEERKEAVRRAVLSAAFCLVFFIAIPVLIYYFSYFLQLRAEHISLFSKEGVRRVATLQKSIFDYHAGLGGDTHFFRSEWYEWPVIWWPMWYYSGADFMPSGMVSSISCMGNPAVWWTGLAALIYVLISSARRRRSPEKFLLALIGFASQFLPWVFVPRSTFIYHYFASVPFIILCTVLALEAIEEKDRQAAAFLGPALVTASAVLFAGFYPLESGVKVSRRYAMLLRWFKWYNF